MDGGVGGFRPIIASALMISEWREPMGGVNSGFEVVGDNGGISDAESDAFCWNRECKQISFGGGDFHEIGQCGLGFLHGYDGWTDCNISSLRFGLLNGEYNVG